MPTLQSMITLFQSKISIIHKRHLLRLQLANIKGLHSASLTLGPLRLSSHKLNELFMYCVI